MVSGAGRWAIIRPARVTGPSVARAFFQSDFWRRQSEGADMCGNIIEAAGTNSNIRRFLQAGCLCPKPCIPAYGAKRSTGPLSALAAGHFSFIRMYGIYQWRSRGTKSKSRRFCSAGCPIPKPCVRSCWRCIPDHNSVAPPRAASPKWSPATVPSRCGLHLFNVTRPWPNEMTMKQRPIQN